MHKILRIPFVKIPTIPEPLIKKVITKTASYYVDNIDALKSSHELAQKNPLLQKHWVTTPTNNSFQHPTLGRVICEIPGCSDKICNTPCETIIEDAYVGHVTHSNYPGSVFLSGKDFNKIPKDQYAIFYEKPIRNHSAGQYINVEKTTELNKNADAQTLIHIHSSRNPLDDTV